MGFAPGGPAITTPFVLDQQTFFCVARLPFQPDGDLVEIVGPSAHGID
jgi:hypothetical protein